MKKIMLLFLFIFLYFFLPIPKYIELNHLNIIQEINVFCKDNQYRIIYLEINPVKNDRGIEYDLIEYQYDGFSVEEGIYEIENNKNIYKKRAKIHINSCDDKRKILNQIKKSYSS